MHYYVNNTTKDFVSKLFVQSTTKDLITWQQQKKIWKYEMDNMLIMREEKITQIVHKLTVINQLVNKCMASLGSIHLLPKKEKRLHENLTKKSKKESSNKRLSSRIWFQTGFFMNGLLVVKMLRIFPVSVCALETA